MENLSSQEANELSASFLGLAQAIGDYRFNKWNDLSVEENKILGNSQWSILNYGEDFLALSTTLVMDEVKTSLADIKTISEKIRKNINGLQNINKGILIASAIITLGGAIISKNPQAIKDALSNTKDVWEKVKPKKDKNS